MKTASVKSEATVGQQIPAWKGVLDLFVIFVTSPVWIPVAALLVAWIGVVSPGPVIFRQQRVGAGGRRFSMWKFRTMCVDAVQTKHEDHLDRLVDGDFPMTKVDAQDERLIAGAKWVRALGLDELAQIVNVLKGEMSLVGPRPCTVSEYDRYAGLRGARTAVLPGITGWWQTNGKNRLTFRRMLELDEYYAGHASLWMDMGILFRTTGVVFEQLMDHAGQSDHSDDVHGRVATAGVDQK